MSVDVQRKGCNYLENLVCLNITHLFPPSLCLQPCLQNKTLLQGRAYMMMGIPCEKGLGDGAGGKQHRESRLATFWLSITVCLEVTAGRAQSLN